MRRDLDRLTATTFDLLVIGGGIHGLAAAYDAALRGLTVALVEREDFGSGASFNNLRTVHGGLRSLQTGDLRKFRLSIRERRTFARIAPHLVEPLAFLLPTTRTLTRSRPVLTAAFLIDALLGADRNRGLPPRLQLPHGRTISRGECLAIDPLLAAQGQTQAELITGGALWYDYQMPRIERLTLAFAHAAAESGSGAVLANYVDADRLLTDGGRAIGARLRDRLTGATIEVRARAVLNAAGAGIPALLAASRVDRALPLPLQKAVNLVTTKPMSNAVDSSRLAATPIAIAGSHAGGTLIRVPWHGRAIIGTWHASAADAAATLDITPQELDRVIADINATFPGLTLDREEVTLVHRGLVPAQVDGAGLVRMQNESVLLDHQRDGVAGLISIRGAKYTTARAVAAAAIDLIERASGRGPTPSRTAETPLPGAPAQAESMEALADTLCRTHPFIGTSCARHLAATYGTRGRNILALAAEMPALAEPIDPPHPAIRAEIVYAVREEMALTLADVTARRVGLGAAGYPGDRAAQACASIMRDECGWSDARVIEELAALRALYRPV